MAEAQDFSEGSFGKHIKRLRKVRKLSQEELAERSGLAADTVRRLEHADFSPSLKTLRKVCGGMGISVSTLFSGFEQRSHDPFIDDLVALLEGCSPETVRVVTRVARELLTFLGETE